MTVAALCDRTDCVRVLLSSGAKYEMEQPEGGCTSLHIAAEFGYYDIVKLIGKSAHVGHLNKFGSMSYTPLMYAVQNNHTDCVKLLLSLGADVNAHDENNAGDTAIHVACELELVEMVEFLIENGAGKRIKGWAGMMPEEKIPQGKTGDKIRGMLI